MFDQATLAQLESGYQASRPKPQAQPKPNPRKSWLSALPTLAASAASLVPGVGTAGAAALGGLGEFGRQALSGEDINAGKIGQEAVLSAIPGGLGKLGRTAVRGRKAVKTVKNTKQEPGAAIPAAPAIPKTPPAVRSDANGLVTKTPPTVTPTTPAAPIVDGAAATPPASSMLSRVKSRMTAAPEDKTLTASAGSRLRGNARNITAGEKIPGTQDVLDQQTADRVNQTVSKYNKGMTGRTPRGQLRSVQDGLKTKGAELDELTTRFDNKLDDKAYSTLSKSLEEKRARIVSFDPAKKEHIELNNNFATRVNNAKSVRELEQVRKDFDKEARRVLQNPDSKGTLSANLAKTYRDAIDDYVSAVNPALKAAKGEYRDLRMAEDFLSKSGTLNQKGVNVVVGKTPGGNAIAAGKEAAGKALETIGGDSTGARLARGLTGQVATRAVAAPFLNEPSAGETVTEETPISDTTTLETPPSTINPTGDRMANLGGDQVNQALQAAALQALARGDTQGIAAIKSVMDIVGTAKKAEKPLSAEASKIVSNAQTGLSAIDDFEQLIKSDPGAFTRSNIPGKGIIDDLTGGRASGALGTTSIDAAGDQIIDVVARLRTGAAISKQEEERFKRYIPRSGDPPEAIEMKLGYLRDQFQMVANRSGSASTDIEQAITGA